MSLLNEIAMSVNQKLLMFDHHGYNTDVFSFALTSQHDKLQVHSCYQYYFFLSLVNFLLSKLFQAL